MSDLSVSYDVITRSAHQRRLADGDAQDFPYHITSPLAGLTRDFLQTVLTSELSLFYDVITRWVYQGYLANAKDFLYLMMSSWRLGSPETSCKQQLRTFGVLWSRHSLTSVPNSMTSLLTGLIRDVLATKVIRNFRYHTEWSLSNVSP